MNRAAKLMWRICKINGDAPGTATNRNASTWSQAGAVA
jgi:hypothetical protein